MDHRLTRIAAAFVALLALGSAASAQSGCNGLFPAAGAICGYTGGSGKAPPSIIRTLPSGLTIPSPALTVAPTAPTASVGTNTTQVATAAFVAAQTTASVATMTALRAAAPGAYVSVYLNGFYSAGDGGEGVFVWTGGASATDDNGVVIQPNAGGTGRWIRDTWATQPNVVWWGAVCDAATDDATPLLAARTWSQTNRRIVYLPSTFCATTQTIAFSVSGSGFSAQSIGGNIHDVGAAPTGPGIKWTGSAGGTVISMIAPSGGSNQSLTGIQLQYLTIDCASSAAIGIDVKSVRRGVLDMSTILNCTSYGLRADTVVTLGEGGDTQHFFLNELTIHPTASGVGILLNGTGNGNASFLHFNGLSINHESGKAIFIKNADNVDFTNVQIFRRPGGTGIGVDIACETSPAICASGIHFYHLNPGAGGVTARTGTQYNTIVDYDAGNGSPAPTIEAGAYLCWKYDSNLSNCGPSLSFIATAVLLNAINTNSGQRFNITANDSTRRTIISTDSDGANYRSSIELSSGDVHLPNASTTASGANTFMDGTDSNKIMRSTSSARYKHDIQNIGILDALRVLFIEPIVFRSNIARDGDGTYFGFTAEQVAKVDARFVNFDAAGKPDGVQYDRLIVPVIGLLRFLIIGFFVLCGIMGFFIYFSISYRQHGMVES